MKPSIILVSSALASTLLGCPSSNQPDAGLDAYRTPDATLCHVDSFNSCDDAGSDAQAPSDVPSTTDAFSGADGFGGPDAFSPDAFSPDAFVPSTALGDCNSNAECPGGRCVALTPGGYRVCQVAPVPATACDLSRPDACCSNADCTSPAQCLLGPIVERCGGPVRLPFNECATDECRSNADCREGLCVPAGVTGSIARCITGSCRIDSDCSAEPGGHCILSTEPCCGTRGQMACRYPTRGCSTSADCPAGYCEVRDGRSVCVTGVGPICPL